MKFISKKVKPRIMFRDATDFFIMLFIGIPLQIGPLLVLPSILVFFLARAFSIGIEISFLYAFAAYIVIYLSLLTFVVWSLHLSENGIKFTRFLGRPKSLRWDEIIDISEVSRKEVIVRGWLWLLFPAREMTPCLSSLRHFRIQWDSDCCYFPPADPDTFLQLVYEFRKKESV